MAARRFHTYAIDSGVLAFGGADPKNGLSFQVEAALDFLWTKSAAFIYDANGLGVDPAAAPFISVIISEGSSAQPICDEVPVTSLFGTGQLPFILPAMHLIKGGTQILVDLNNRHTGTPYTCELAFCGVLVPAGTGEEIIANSKRG